MSNNLNLKIKLLFIAIDNLFQHNNQRLLLTDDDGWNGHRNVFLILK